VVGPGLSPDGRRLLFWTQVPSLAGRPPTLSLWIQDLAHTDGLGEPERLTTAPTGRWQNPLAFTPDGSTLIYQESEKGTDFDLWALPMTGRREPRALFNSRTETGSTNSGRRSRCRDRTLFE